MSHLTAYPHLAARVFNTPLLIHPAKLDAIIAGLGGRLLGADVQASALPAPMAFTTAEGERVKPGHRTVGGVAVIDVFGVLAHRGGIDAQSNFVLGYQTVARQLEAALADDAVQSILLNLDSPGGEVAGAFDLAEQITAARGKKPIHAIAGDMAASAAYLIGSAAESFAVTQTGYVGSIGVVMRHVDFSQALASEGVRVTHIFAGSHKVDGNPYEPLPEAVRADMQAEIDGLYEMFVATVARQRGIDPAVVRATEAQVFRGAAAVAAGLADRVATPDQLIAELRATPARAMRAQPRANTRRSQMQNSQAPAGGEQDQPVFAQADLDRARAEGHAAGLAAGRTEGAAAERERANAIHAHAEAAGRTALAQQCVANGLTVEQAGAILAASPRETAAASGNAFAAAMAGVSNPSITPEPADGGDASQAVASRIVSLFTRRSA